MGSCVTVSTALSIGATVYDLQPEVTPMFALFTTGCLLLVMRLHTAGYGRFGVGAGSGINMLDGQKWGIEIGLPSAARFAGW